MPVPARLLLLVLLLLVRRSDAQSLGALDSVVPSLMRQHGVPGVALAIVRGDSVVALEGYGYARLRDSARVDPARTMFRLASIAKLFVATAVLQQVETGRVNLNTDVNAYIAWRVPDTWPAPITLERLLTHTAGFDERLIGYAAPSLDAIGDLGAHLEVNLRHRGWPPGEVIGYSNYGFALAAHVVERASGVPFDRYARERIFQPLGMTRTFYLSAPDSLASDAADGYACGPSRCFPAPVVYSRPYPVGLAYSTAGDMARFLIAQLDGKGAVGKNRILAPSSVAFMQQQHFTADPSLPGMSYGFFNQRNYGRRVLAHTGNVPGFNNLVLLIPEERLGIYFVANGGRMSFGAALRDTLLSLLLAPPTIARAPTIALSPSYLQSLAGNYQVTRFAHSTIEAFPSLFRSSTVVGIAGGRLAMLFPSRVRQFEPLDSLHFHEVGGEHTIAFKKDAAGRVTLMAAAIPVFGAELPGTLERRAWYEGAHFMNEYVSWLAIGPLMIIMALWLAAAVSWWRAPESSGTEARGAPRDRLERLVVWGAIAFVPLWLLFGFEFIARSVRMFENATGLVYGVPTDMRVMAVIPWILAALAALLVVGAVQSWRRTWWDALRRVLLSALALGAVLVVVFLAQWNYLPVVF